MYLAQIHKGGYIRSEVYLNPWTEISVSCPFMQSLLELGDCTGGITIFSRLFDEPWTKINHRFEINHLCEFGPFWLFLQERISFRLLQ